jgi:SAM-dependent methyltransferase
MQPPSLKEDLKRLITHALEVQYTSESNVDKQLTGNHYQSVTLGTTQTSGFRTPRQEFLQKVNFKDKRVLDLGCNLGEMSRSARRYGASWVDGYEYDPYFVQIAQLVNVYNDVTRVNFYQGDISDPALYSERYDIVLAFAVWVYIMRVMDKIAEITQQALVLETHKLEDNLNVYIELIGKHFPYHHVLGFSDWATSLDKREKRGIIVFGKSQQALESVLSIPAHSTASVL